MVYTKQAHDSLLDLDSWVGQRQCTYRFDLLDGVSGISKGQIYPLRGATLSHDTGRTIKRQLNMTLGIDDTALVDPVTDRVDLSMVFPNGASYPMGRYLFTDSTRQVFTNGKMSNVILSDEMFIVDQPIATGITANVTVQTFGSGVDAGVFVTAENVIRKVMSFVPSIEYVMESSRELVSGAWAAGTTRGQMLEALALSGDFFSPWFGNDKKMHFIRTFEPGDEIPDFDWDSGNSVLRASIIESDNLLTAPNQFIVVSNGASDMTASVTGQYDVPPNAPHSKQNRGFVIASVTDMQIHDVRGANNIARAIGIRNTVFEVVTLTTAPDPRHDSYNVVHWQGSNWLELGWSLSLTEGAAMQHRLRKAYSTR